MTSDRQHKIDRRRIEVEEDGPYTVYGSVPLVRKVQVVSEYGEPLTWKKEGVIATEDTYQLCRCGQSGSKPFCDMTHFSIDFDGTESADTTPTAQRQLTIEGGTAIVVKCDHYLCMHSGFCANQLTNISELVADTADTSVRSQVIAMIERCPSSALTYSIQEGEPDIEPDLPQQIAVTTDITSDGPIAGALWVTGNIPIQRADGQPFETLNRVTLCCCGRSQNKPLCDGTHRVTSAQEITDR